MKRRNRMNYLITFIFMSMFCVRAFAGISIQVSPGLDIYNEGIGYNANITTHFPFKLFNKKNPDINPGIMLFGSYVNSDGVNIINYGGGFDLGYIFSFGNVKITPAFCAGYQMGSIVYHGNVIADFNNIVLYPHLAVGLTLLDDLHLNFDAGYKMNYLNKRVSSVPDTINNISINLTIGFGGRDYPKPTVFVAATNTTPVTPKVVKAPVVSVEKILVQSKELISSGNKEEAIKLLESTQAKNPDNQDVKEMLVLLKSSNIELVTVEK